MRSRNVISLALGGWLYASLGMAEEPVEKPPPLAVEPVAATQETSAEELRRLVLRIKKSDETKEKAMGRLEDAAQGAVTKPEN